MQYMLYMYVTNECNCCLAELVKVRFLEDDVVASVKLATISTSKVCNLVLKLYNY